jgi:iron complex outermembrane receptor protein/hemoglobin/transferrin/lactoferrin receptor protein
MALWVAPAVGPSPDPSGRTYDGPTAVEGPPAVPTPVPASSSVADPASLPAASLTPPQPTAAEPDPKAGKEPVQRTIRVPSRAPPVSERDRAGSVVTREDLDERLPRSSPDALRGEPGVHIQQTSHGQASPYLRGLTGQQTVMFFDGVRINNSTFRQGPNQYFFTIDSRSVQSLEVVRGSASTRWGSDALGGSLLATPVEPEIDPGKRVAVHPRAFVRQTSADSELGSRGQTSVSLGGKVGLLVGAGYRKVGLLKSGGRFDEPATGRPQTVPPIFGPDGKTQLGTGFRELTDDLRLVWQQSPKNRFTLGYYDYRQFDAPRTDKCPPRTAPQDECLTYLQQFRTLLYGAYDLTDGPAAAERVHLTISYQNQHEKRREHRGSPSTTELTGKDDDHVSGVGLKIDTKEFVVAPWATVGARYGTDAYFDVLQSEESITFTDVDVTVERPRGQYLPGATYLTSGVWAEAHAEFVEAIRLRAGGRFAAIAAHAEGEPMTESKSVDEQYFNGVGTGGIAADAVDWLTFVFNVDQGFRAPNLNDLTGRQQVGPGYQYENTDLRPERSLSMEVGAIANQRWFQLSAFAFRTAIDDLIQRTSRDLADCPANDIACMASRERNQLVNLDGTALIYGAEGDLRIYLPLGFRLRGTISYAWGEGTNPRAGLPLQADRVPLSRIPPLNGIGEISWRGWGMYATGVVRWARLQDRLAPQDRVDVRIPRGGTPGYVVFDVRTGYRLGRNLLLALVFENVGDVAYRHHGSSVNAPGRGVMFEMQLGL